MMEMQREASGNSGWSRLLNHPGLRAAIAAALLILLITTGRLDLTVVRKATFGWPLFSLAAVTLAALVATSLRWVSLVRAAGRNDGGLPVVGLGTNALTYVSPAGTGTDAARVLYLLRRGVCGPGEASAIAAVDRLMGLHSLLLVGTLVGCAAAFSHGSPLLGYGLGAAGLLSIAGLYALFRFAEHLSPKGPLTAWRSAVVQLRVRLVPGWLAAACISSLVAAFANGALPWLALSVFGPTPTNASTLLASVLVVLVNGAAPTPGGIGAGEAAAAELYAQSGPGAAAMLLVRTVGLLFSLFLAAGWLLRGGSSGNVASAAAAGGEPVGPPNPVEEPG